MSCAPKVRGVIVPLVTPVQPDGRPDLAAAVRLARWLLATGVSGFFVGGTTGRFSHFTPEELAAVCRAVAEAVRGKAPVIGGVCDSGLHRMQANAERMAAAGADYVVATAPFYLRHSDAEREAMLARLIETSPLPVILYNIPEMVGAALRAEWILEIGGHPNVAGLKDSSNDYAFFERVLRGRPRKEFALVQGKEPLLARSVLAGADGIVVSLVHLDPKLFAALYRAAVARDRRTAERCQRAIQKLYDDLQAGLKRAPVFSTLLRALERGIASHGVPARLLENCNGAGDAGACISKTQAVLG